jgi:hypothetical protein
MPPTRWLGAAGALAVAGLVTAFALTSGLGRGGDGEPEAGETSAALSGPDAAPSSSIGADESTSTGDEPQAGATVDPPDEVDPVKDTVRARCAIDRIRVLFDRETGALAVVGDEGRPIASIAPASYIFQGDSCRAAPVGIKPYSDEALEAPVYASGGIACTVGRGVEVEIHPIVSGTTASQTGNNLVISIRDRATVVVSGVVVEELTGRRFSYSSKHCTPL